MSLEKYSGKKLKYLDLFRSDIRIRNSLYFEFFEKGKGLS